MTYTNSENTLTRHLPRKMLWAYLAAFACIPLKLSWTYLFLLPTIAWFIMRHHGVLRKTLHDPVLRSLWVPLVLFLAAASYTSLFGIHPLTSWSALARIGFYSIIIPMGIVLLRKDDLVAIRLLITTGAIAAMYSVINSASGGALPQLFHGAVTQSGQLSLLIPLALGIAFYEPGRQARRDNTVFACAGATLLGFILLGFHASLSLHWGFIVLLVTPLFVFAGVHCASTRHRLHGLEFSRYLIQTLGIPLLLAALFLNLKRGPWMGVLISSLLLVLMLRPKRTLLVIAISLAAILSLSPVRERLSESLEHFFISGGRSTIWSIGADLATRYPLGIGFDNSGFLREFSSEVPPELTHFHNNLINVSVETGWLGLIVYLWWIIGTLVYLSRSASVCPQYKSIFLGMTCSILSWQIAGMVEYNFGDSEVFLLAMAILGSAAGLRWYCTYSPTVAGEASHLVRPALTPGGVFAD